MNKKPEALKLADILQHKLPSVHCLEVAAAELRRLHDENERLRAELAEAEAVRERCNERAFRLEAEVERLREALEIIAGYRPCIDSLMGNQDIAIAALRREETP